MRQGIVLLNKPEGKTSFQALNSVKKYFNTSKVGHTGTLDKFASGLLVVLLGRYTKLAEHFLLKDKVYEAEICFGKETETLDPEGLTVKTANLPVEQVFRQVVPQFVGKIRQIPPLYSAIHVNGQRLYKYARKNESVTIPERSVNIKSIEVLSFEPSKAKILVHCSSGTYIRSLGRDLAYASATVGHLCSLKRVSVGSFFLEDSVLPESINEEALLSLKDCGEALSELSFVELDDKDAEKVLYGQQPEQLLQFCQNRKGLVAVYNKSQLIAVLKSAEGLWKYVMVNA